MRYESERNGISAASVILGIAVLLLLIVGGGALVYWQQSESSKRLDPTHIADGLLQNRSDGQLMRELKKLHPEDFRRIVDYIAELRRKGVGEQEVLLEARKMLASMAMEMRKNMQQAPADDLARYRKTLTALIEQLEREDVEVCGQFAIDPSSIKGTGAAERQAAMKDLSFALFRAAAAARDTPARRVPQAELNAKDAAALISAMRREGISDSDLEVLADDKRMKRAPARQRCSIAKALWHAADSLPPAAAERATLVLIGV